MIHEFGNPMDNPGSGYAAWQGTTDQRTDIEKDYSHLSIHDPESADIATAHRLAREQVEISGANVRVYVRTNNQDRDYVWDEDPNPSYHNPINMKAFFKPQALEAELKRWGVDTTNKAEIVFVKEDLTKLWPERLLRPGDVIEIPYNSPANNGPRFFVIKNATPSGNFRYTWLYYTCATETLSADATVRVIDDVPMNDMEDNERGEYNG